MEIQLVEQGRLRAMAAVARGRDESTAIQVHGREVASMFLGTAEQILRFSLDGDALVNLEAVIENLPYDTGYLHPLKHFVFDRDGNLIVNIGSRTDRCEETTPRNDCVSGEEASLRRYAYDRDTNSWNARRRPQNRCV